MKFKTHNDSDIDICGTHLQGEIDVSYSTIVKVFGEPDGGDGYKSDACWGIEFEDGTIATIYDYKTGKNYCGSHGVSARRNRDWHIGEFDSTAVDHVTSALKSA